MANTNLTRKSHKAATTGSSKQATSSRKGARGQNAASKPDLRLLKALSHPLRVQILEILNAPRMASPNELSKELNEGLSQISYHVKVLREFECIELVKTEPRRGAVEHFYRARVPSIVPEGAWRRLPIQLRSRAFSDLLDSIADDVIVSAGAGTLDRRDETHISRTTLVVDDLAWDRISAVVEKAHKALLQIQDDALDRAQQGDWEGFSATVAILSFESARASEGKPNDQSAQSA